MKISKLAGQVAFAVCGLFLGAAAQAQVSEHTFRLSHAGATGHPGVLGAEKWAELVKQKSGGKLQIKVFANGVLGGDVQALSAVQGGTVDFTSMNSGILQTQVKEFAIFDFPFMFENGKEADAILDGAFGQKLGDLLPAKNLVNLAYWELGFRELTNSKRPLTKMEDIAGLKIRVIQSPIYIETFNALGANSVPMPFTEVYTALEQKIIDGIIPEPPGGAHRDPATAAASLKAAILAELVELKKLKADKLVEKRIAKFCAMGAWNE